MPRKSPEEKAALKKMLEAEKGNFAVLDAHTRAEQHRWDEEIAMLERRVKEKVAEADLGDGDKILLRTRISAAEESRLTTLRAAFNKGDQDAAFEIVAMVTANQRITAEWLKENPERFAVIDILDVIFDYFETQAQHFHDRNDRVSRLITFRPESAGTKSG